MPGTISTEQALIYTMVTMSGVEGKINAIELAEIRQLETETEGLLEQILQFAH